MVGLIRRHANGVVGARTFGESELQRLVQAQHAVWSACPARACASCSA